MRRLVSKTQFAALARVTQAAITKACKGPLADALEGVRIDLDHVCAQQYLEGKGIDPTELSDRLTASVAAPAASRQTDPPNAATEASSLGGDVGSIAELTIRQIVERFGTEVRFKDYLSNLKAIEDIRSKRLQNEEAEGALIERERVKTHVFGMIDGAHRRLLTDAPKTIARRLYAMARSESPVEDAESTVRDIISSQLRVVIATARRVLNEGELGKAEGVSGTFARAREELEP